MNLSLLSSINYLAVATSSVIFFFIGGLWFSSLFAKMWLHELSLHNVTIKQPSKNKMLTNLLVTFLNNSIIVFALACLVQFCDSTTVLSGLMLGLLVAGCFSATAIGGVFLWEGRSIKLFLIDIGYQIAGIVTSAIILSLWR